MVLKALESIKKSTHIHYHIAFIDDNSNSLPDLPEVSYYNTKEDPKGYIGKYMNMAMKDHSSCCEAAIMLCDDDALHPDYLTNLCQFFYIHHNLYSCYSHIIPFDPFTGKELNYSLNAYEHPINGCCMVDASQVAWRLPSVCEFSYPLFACHDADFYQKLYDKTGPMYFSGFHSQYKGIHKKQLGTLGVEKATSGISIDLD